jgi:hypothetical protein
VLALDLYHNNKWMVIGPLTDRKRTEVGQEADMAAGFVKGGYILKKRDKYEPDYP